MILLFTETSMEKRESQNIDKKTIGQTNFWENTTKDPRQIKNPFGSEFLVCLSNVACGISLSHS